jgi:phenylacetate-CoA ligase
MKEDELKKIQEKKLRKLINHSYANVQFYQELFNSLNLKPYDIQTLNDLKKIPIITKEEVRENYPDKVISRNINFNKCHIESTTGSTGLPLKICFSNKERLYMGALFNYFYSEAGAKWYDQIFMIRHFPTSLKDGVRDKLKVKFYGSKSISVFEPIESIIEKLIKINPAYIITFPSMLSLIAEEIKAKNIHKIKPKMIFAMSETLTDSLREKLSEIFNSDIIGHYGSEEFGTLAFECKEHTGYHIIADHAIIEIVKDHKNIDASKKGEVIVTGLNNYTMPLIRYKLGDIALLSDEKCKCGRGLPLIKQIIGREDDYIILPSGKKISPRMINVIENIPGILSYKTIQESRERLLVKLVKGKEFSRKTIHEVQKQIKLGCLGEDIEVEVKIVKEIPRASRGKIRAIVSNLS